MCAIVGTSAFVISRSARSAGVRGNYHLLVLCQHPTHPTHPHTLYEAHSSSQDRLSHRLDSLKPDLAADYRVALTQSGIRNCFLKQTSGQCRTVSPEGSGLDSVSKALMRDE